MKPRSPRRADELLRRITGEADARDTLGRVARELRRRHEGRHERRGRQVAARLAASTPRRGTHREPAARTVGARR